MTAPETLDIIRSRGDTYPMQLSIKDSVGVAVDITSFTYLLTVDPSSDPLDSANNLFQITGVVDDGPNGLVSFTPTLADADQTPNTYFYDIQQIDTGGAKRTIAKGKWKVLQDITKD